MVWFQCEDCGENLKKPKLPNHFRICSAIKLSCIDCGEMFGQQTVQSHSQCITEAEKYGPKGEGKISNIKAAKPMKDNQKPDFDVYVGLSDRPPWFCSLCNTQTTSKQTLLGHAEGKKHRAKARAFHAANQPPKLVEEESTQTHVDSKDKTAEKELLKDNRDLEDKKSSCPLNAKSEVEKSPAENGNTPTKRKRKINASEGDADMNCPACYILDCGNGHAEIQGGEEKRATKAKKTKSSGQQDHVVKTNGGSANSLKLKKLITSTLKSTANGVLKMRKLQKLVLRAFEESGIQLDENELRNSVEEKINSSSKFEVDGKYVRLATKRKDQV